MSTTVDSTTTTTTTTTPDGSGLGLTRALVVGWLNGTKVSEKDYDRLFDAELRDEVPYSTFKSLLSGLAAEAPWRQSAVLEDESFSTAFRVTSKAGDSLVVSIVVDADSGRFTGLLFEPDAEFDPPGSVDEAVRRLRESGTVRLLVADGSDGSCSPTLDDGSTEAMPIGSIFKLYVLGAVVAAVDAGTTSWDAAVTIDDALDSLPSGDTRDLEPGTKRTVRELAEAMITVSDNTATDHLIDHVGRDSVEAVLDPMGNDAVEENTPFLTTRELFVLKWGTDGLGEQYVEADEDGRRALLDGEVAAAPLPPLVAVDPGDPVLVEELEWFASPAALCRALLVLASDENASEILAINPGLPAKSPHWSQILFKGGSEPGLVAVAWLTTAPDGTVRVTTGSVVNPKKPIDEMESVQLFGFIRDSGV